MRLRNWDVSWFLLVETGRRRRRRLEEGMQGASKGGGDSLYLPPFLFFSLFFLSLQDLRVCEVWLCGRYAHSSVENTWVAVPTCSRSRAQRGLSWRRTRPLIKTWTWTDVQYSPGHLNCSPFLAPATLRPLIGHLGSSLLPPPPPLSGCHWASSRACWD